MTTTSKRQKKKYCLHPEDVVVVIPLPYFDDGIAKLAYFKAEKRGFVPGYALDDWLEAEKEFVPR
ncbi:MAG: DUF2934 domain-containing protein [Methylomonas sp.]|jgi:hypothetical protein|uniref:DUF2934 domain-containing protein n=1 Tax=Methylomonas sp. TaxID=418 RepID=UPI0025D17012|nr:DUF2934 domain-containing protein [Methylomonas sp.]MCK9607088.1 DUF2934 domain-containing protein [Methylomonas sp.]